MLWGRILERNRRDVEEKSEQLKAISTLAALISGFALTAFLQFDFGGYQDRTGVALPLFGISMALTVRQHGLAGVCAGLRGRRMRSCCLSGRVCCLLSPAEHAPPGHGECKDSGGCLLICAEQFIRSRTLCDVGRHLCHATPHHLQHPVVAQHVGQDGMGNTAILRSTVQQGLALSTANNPAAHRIVAKHGIAAK